MKNVDSFTFFRSYHEALKELSDRDRKSLLVAIDDYVFEDKTPELKGMKKSIWFLIEPHLRVSKSKSGNARKKSNQNQNEIKLKSNQDESSEFDLLEKENKKKNKNMNKNKNSERKENKEKRTTVLTSPTLTDIISYAETLGVDDNDYCERFFNHYTAIDWVNGTGNKISNWKLVFNNWVKKDKAKSQEKPAVQKSKLDTVFDKFMESEDE